MRTWAILVLAATVVAGCAQAPLVGPGPDLARDPAAAPGIPSAGVHASTVSGGAEPMVLTDRNGQYVWVGDSSGGSYSVNNGTSFAHMPGIAAGFHALNDGWAFAQDEAGDLYAADLSENHVDIGRSHDGGRSWDQTTYLAGVSGAADRPWLAARGGDVVLFYFDAPAVVTGFFEHCARSTDGGLTFVDRNPTSGPPQAGRTFYDSRGSFYYAQDGGSIYQFASTCLAGGHSIGMIGNVGTNNMIQGDVDGTDLYMAAATSGAAQITLAGVQEGGTPKSIVVSPPSLKANTYATLSAWNGQVAVAWYGSTTEGDPSQSGYNGDFDVYLSVVDGFWTSDPQVSTVRITDQPNHHGWICMGGISCTSGRGLLDYFGIDHDKWGGLHIAYVDDTSGSKVEYVHLPPQSAVLPPPPPPGGTVVADFSATVHGLDVDVDAGTSSGATTYSWNWGDGETGDGVTTSHTYAAAGTYTITLQASDDAGATDSHSTDIVVGAGDNQAPSAAFTWSPAAPLPGKAVQFTDQSSDDTGIVLRTWDFGDGGRATSEAPTHTFKAGTYTVRLEVTDGGGATDSTTHSITVSETPPPSTSTPKKAGAPEAVFVLSVVLGLAVLRRRR